MPKSTSILSPSLRLDQIDEKVNLLYERMMASFDEAPETVVAPPHKVKQRAVSLQYFEAPGDPQGRVFVRVPDERGRWVLTDKSVVEVECPACGAMRYEPCRNIYKARGGMFSYWTTTHADRRVKRKNFVRENVNQSSR
jgi:hypothetical protein